MPQTLKSLRVGLKKGFARGAGLAPERAWDMVEVVKAHFWYRITAFYSMLLGPQHAEDAADDVLVLRLPKTMARYDETRPLTPWIWGIVFNVGRERRRDALFHARSLSEPLWASRGGEADDERSAVSTIPYGRATNPARAADVIERSRPACLAVLMGLTRSVAIDARLKVFKCMLLYLGGLTNRRAATLLRIGTGPASEGMRAGRECLASVLRDACDEQAVCNMIEFLHGAGKLELLLYLGIGCIPDSEVEAPAVPVLGADELGDLVDSLGSLADPDSVPLDDLAALVAWWSGFTIADTAFLFGVPKKAVERRTEEAIERLQSGLSLKGWTDRIGDVLEALATHGLTMCLACTA